MKKGDVIEILNHRLRIKKIYLAKSSYCGFTEDRVSLSCMPGCCTSPYGLKIDLTLKELQEWNGEKKYEII